MHAESGKLGIQEFSLSLSMYIFTAFVARLGDHALQRMRSHLTLCPSGSCQPSRLERPLQFSSVRTLAKAHRCIGRRAGTDTAILGTIFLVLLGTVELLFAEQIAHLYSE